MSAPIFSTALQKLACKYTIGISATPERPDGLTRLLYWSMGDIVFRCERENEQVLVNIGTISSFESDVSYKNGQIAMPLMLNKLATHQPRNKGISMHIHNYYLKDRNIIVLSSRIEQLNLISDMLLTMGVIALDIGFYIGTTPSKDREEVSQRKIILSTYSMAKEGLDIPRLDTLIMSLPSSNIEQAVGRIQRSMPNKKIPLVLDIIDNSTASNSNTTMFAFMSKKRKRFYDTNGFTCKTACLLDTAHEWHC